MGQRKSRDWRGDFEDAFNSVDQIRSGLPFRDETVDIKQPGQLGNRRALVYGIENDTCLREPVTSRTRDGGTASTGQADVQDDEIRFQGFNLRDGVIAIGCFTANIPMRLQERGQARANDFMIVHDQDANGVSGGSS